MAEVLTQVEEKNKKRGMTISVVAHVGLILLALLPLLTFPDPPPGQEGILVNLGLPDQGEGDENAAASAEEEEAQPEPEPETTEEETVDEEVVEEEPVREEPKPEKEVVKTEDPEALALKRKKEEERKEEEAKKREEARKKKAEEDAKRKREAEEAAKRAEEARKKAEADKLKNQIGGLFGDGSGKGKTGTSGNQGDPNGDPDASKLEGISKGRGQVGGGLSDRGVARTDTPSAKFNRSGTVTVSVCVDKGGRVTSAKITQRGTSINDAQLHKIALGSAKKWRFQQGAIDKQCGTITYNFKKQ
ncbi:MAG: energy transducer TonB [Saprospiraceae bacterium]|nr:energy transducer TonB [Saprospiraceae bacterium]